MPSAIDVVGAEQLSQSLGQAATRVQDMSEPNREVAETLTSNARPPRRSGRLAGSLTPWSSPTEAGITSGLPYAAVIENGWAGHGIEAQHYATEAADRSGPAVTAIYERWMGDLLADVKGA